MSSDICHENLENMTKVFMLYDTIPHVPVNMYSAEEMYIEYKRVLCQNAFVLIVL